MITDPAASPYASGSLFGMRIGNGGDYGQGTEIGQGVWLPIQTADYKAFDVVSAACR
jgi:hypothetical protein